MQSGDDMNKTEKKNDDQELKKLIKNLSSNSLVERKNARKKLASMGIVVIDILSELIMHPKYQIRWEAVKILEEIDDPVAIPLLIQAMEDEYRDIRWIAADGLIKLGRKSILPVLKAVIDSPGSIFILSGAHHVLHDLMINKKLPRDFPIKNFLSAIKYPELNSGIKSLAYDLVKKTEK